MNSLYHPITSNHLRTDTECRLFQALSLLIFALFSLLSSLFSYLSLHILTNIHYLLIFIPFHFAYQLIYLLLHSHIHKFIISSIHTFTHSHTASFRDWHVFSLTTNFHQTCLLLAEEVEKWKYLTSEIPTDQFSSFISSFSFYTFSFLFHHLFINFIFY